MSTVVTPGRDPRATRRPDSNAHPRTEHVLNEGVPGVGQVALEPAALHGCHVVVQQLRQQRQRHSCSTAHSTQHGVVSASSGASRSCCRHGGHASELTATAAHQAEASPSESFAAVGAASFHIQSRPPASRVGKAVAQLRELPQAVAADVASRVCGMLLQPPSACAVAAQGVSDKARFSGRVGQPHATPKPHLEAPACCGVSSSSNSNRSKSTQVLAVAQVVTS